MYIVPPKALVAKNSEWENLKKNVDFGVAREKIQESMVPELGSESCKNQIKKGGVWLVRWLSG